MSETPSRAPLEPTIDHTRPNDTTIAIPEAPGYVLYERVGVGGMGEVYRCGEDALGRDLAIKVIKSELHGNADAEERFLREARLTGSLQHPGIVPIHQLGRLADGRPYYTMKLIRGRTFADMLRNEPQGPERLPCLLAVVEKLCQAVAYAHSKGVIHRDLKPNNVMVGEFGEVQVMDWGLAKELHAGAETYAARSSARPAGEGETGEWLDQATGLSRAGAALGTLAYMPPEQAAGDWDIVDERADVFALGSVLCEVLTGRPTYHGSNQEEGLRQVRRGDVTEAVQRLQQCGADAELVQLVRDCLAAERAARPRTAGVVAKRLAAYEAAVQERLRQAELERVAAQTRAQEEQARAALEQERMREALARAAAERRAARRLLGLAAAVVVFVLAAAAGLAIAMQTVRAEQGRTQTALDRVTAEQHKTQTAWKQTRQALNTLTDDVVEELLGKQAWLGQKEKDFLRRALGFYQRFAAERGEDEESRAVAAEGQYRVAQLQVFLGETKNAEMGYQAAGSLYEKLADDFPAVPQYRQELAKSYNNRGALLADRGKGAEAEAAYRQARTLQEKLVSEHPTVPEYRQDLARSNNNLANLLADRGNGEEAEKAFHNVLTLREKLATDFPAVPQFRRDLATSHSNLGNLLRDRGKSAEAEAAYRKALALRAKLAGDYPAVPQYRQHLATSHINLGALLAGLGKGAQAEAAYRQALALYEKLAGEFPAVPQYRQDMALSHNNVGILLAERGKGAQAEAAYRRALALYEKLAGDFPAVTQYRQDLAMSHNNLGILLADQDKSAEAEAAYRKALALYERLAGDFPTMPQYRQELAGSSVNFAELLRDRGQSQSALEWYDKAISLLERILAQDPRLAVSRLYLRNAHWGRAQTLGQLGRHAESDKDWRRAIELDNGRMRPDFRVQQALALARSGEYRAAVKIVETLLGSSTPGADARRSTSLLYNAACVYALSAAAVKDDAKLREHYADRAVALLHQVRKAGYFKDPKMIENMRKDADLASLRSREDFKKFLGEFK